jgi:general secretion pathway protein D
VRRKIFCSVLVLLWCSWAYAGKVNFSFYDAPVRDIAVTVSELTSTSISGSFGEARMTLVADNMELSEVLPIFSSSLSSIGLTLVKMDWGYVVRPTIQGTDPGAGWSVHSLTYSRAEDLKNALLLALGTSGSVSAVGEKQILITGPADQVRKYASMVRALDVERAPDVERFPLKHLRVSTAIERLRAENSQVKLIPDFWGHAVIVQGSIQDRMLIQATLTAMDQPSPGIDNKVIPIHTQDPEQILSIIRGLYDDVACFIAGKSLLLSGPSDQLAAAERMIAELDGSSVQVRVECVIASLTDQEFEELGIRLSSSGSISANLNAAGIASLLAPGPGLLVDIVSGSLSTSIASVDTKSRGEVLSSPVVSALSGHAARIVVGQNVPFIEKQTKTQAGESEYSVTRQDVGVTLSITPKVEGDFIYLTVAQEVSNIDPSKTNAVDLITEKKQIESTVKLADGESIFLGGVKSSEKGSTREYVPILGWIPLVGEIFTYRKTTETSRNLVISLRPTIVRQSI